MAFGGEKARSALFAEKPGEAAVAIQRLLSERVRRPQKGAL